MIDQKLKALAEHLGLEKDDLDYCGIHEESHNEFRHKDESYLVLTDEEADKKAAEYIKDSLWAFRPSFLKSYVPEEVDEEIIKIIQEKCESANGAMLRLVGSDLEKLIEDAIAADGRGHFLSGYDGNEHEVGNYLIYRTN